MVQICLDLTEDLAVREVHQMEVVALLAHEAIGGPLPRTDFLGTVTSIGAELELAEMDTAQFPTTAASRFAA